MGKPEIRFKGYTDEWEQRKLIEVGDYMDYRGKHQQKRKMVFSSLQPLKMSRMDSQIMKNLKGIYFQNAYEEVMRRGKPEIGDVLITTEVSVE